MSERKVRVTVEVPDDFDPSKGISFWRHGRVITAPISIEDVSRPKSKREEMLELLDEGWPPAGILASRKLLEEIVNKLWPEGGA